MVLVLIPILILGFYAFSIANENLMTQTRKTMSSNLERVVSEMNSKFDRENDFTKYLAYNLEFRESLEDNAYDSSAIAQSLNKTVEPVFSVQTWRKDGVRRGGRLRKLCGLSERYPVPHG